MLPNVDADDGNVREEGVLVGGGDDLERALCRVNSLHTTHTSLVSDSHNITKRGKKRTSHPQPEPWIPAVVVLNSLIRASTEPKVLTMASLRGPSLSLPPLPLPSLALGARFFQNNEWLMCPEQ